VHSTILSWSGGKDSALALHALREGGTGDVRFLLTAVTRGYDRISIHGVRRSLLEAQAGSLDIPLRTVELEPGCSNAGYEAAFRSALAALKTEDPALTHIAFGDLFLEDVRAYRERLLHGSGLEASFPLWGLDTAKLARRFIASGFEARIVCVDTTQLAGSFAGRAFDEALLADLPGSVDPCGEGGEFHSFVHAGPVFREPIRCKPGEVVLRDARFAYCDLSGPAQP
jgi:uncharacterized protein (TIGR00290 family)